MKFTRLFKTFTTEKNDQQYVYLEDFFSYITHQKKNNIWVIDKNIKRTFNYYEGKIEHYGGKEIISVTSLLRYCFNNFGKISRCEEVCNSVNQELFDSKQTTGIESTGLDLYKSIARANFINNTLLEADSINIDEHTVISLIQEHREEFNEKEWKNIVFFEYHFSNEIGTLFNSLDYDKLLELKYKKYTSLVDLFAHSQKLREISNHQVKIKGLRIKKKDEKEQVQLHTKKVHIPFVIENEIISLIKDCGIEYVSGVVCYDIHQKGQKENCIEVVCVLDAEICGDLSYICVSIFNSTRRRHYVNIRRIYFVKSEYIEGYNEAECFSRYLLRDSLHLGYIQGISYQWEAGSLLNRDIVFGDDDEKCIVCCCDSVLKPLDISTFEVLREWHIETPIETQILLNSFINKESIRKAQDFGSFYKAKIKKLYVIYDSLLNVMNKNYMGIFQNKSTNELLLEYKSVKSVFDITSELGSTFSLSAGERNLKKHANADVCYYRTYLKPCENSYQTIYGDICRTVSLCDCHAILMLDNLVKLTYVADPNPGEKRSKQLCTLPITIQGLPLDHVITKAWHMYECNGNDACSCKQKEILTKYDFDRVLVDLCPKEQDAFDNFSKLMTWGEVQLWRDFPEDLWTSIDQGESTPIWEPEESYLAFLMDTCDETAIMPEQDDDEELHDIISNILLEDKKAASQEQSLSDELSDDDVLDLETSMDRLSVLEPEENDQSCQSDIDLLASFGFVKYCVPELICRHPPPAVGRDDDMSKIAEILDDVLTKMGYNSVPQKRVNRIMCGPDNKIGSSLMKLMETNSKYECFLPEFPLLHLRKSQITILFSAYRDAGIIELLKFMKDDDQTEWSKLVSIQHIDCATRYVRRLAIAFHLAFLIQFARSLSEDDMHLFLIDMEHEDTLSLSKKWNDKYSSFMDKSSKANATFALHKDMMVHCDNVVAISLAERLGGPAGYALLLASVKTSLPFSFVNNASAYAPYCTKMLYHHYSAGHFHRCMKESLFSTPIKNSNRNFGCDTKREMDHLDALKGFRSGSNLSSLTSRMSLIDYLNDSATKPNITKSPDSLGWSISETDKKHIFPTVSVILERNATSVSEGTLPLNVYSLSPTILPIEILDLSSKEIGKYLMLRYCSREKLFQMDSNDTPDIASIEGPPSLLQKAKQSKGVTMKRVIKSKLETALTEYQLQEKERKKIVAKESQVIDCFSSKNNACQALLHPDSSKPKVMKSLGIQKAFKEILQPLISNDSSAEMSKYMIVNVPSIPSNVIKSMKVCLFEFAGIKFKVGNIQTGREYLHYVECFINKIVKDASCLKTVVICEEKYSFTPDDFKASTRQQRKKETSSNINHLKSDTNMLSMSTFCKDTLTKTDNGKKKLSQFLSQNLKSLSIEKDIELIVDSDNYMSQSSDGSDAYSTPIKLTKVFGQLVESFMHEICQRKGEAEMAIIDWLISQKNALEDGQSIVSFITSGDIDAVYIHLYAISQQWPRKSNGEFFAPVYVVLQKPYNKYDIYNITSILEKLEKQYSDRYIGMKIAIVLCMGGNDFIPKFYHIPHRMFVQSFLESHTLRDNLFIQDNNLLLINSSVFVDFIKSMYSPKKLKELNLPYEQTRAFTIGKSASSVKKQGWKTKDPRKWLPPQSCVERLADLVSYQIKYLNTSGKHDAVMPNFLQCQCLKNGVSGDIEYDFGPDSNFESITDLPVYDEKRAPVKRQLQYTPKRGARMKQPMTSTPISKQKCTIDQ